MVLQNKKIKKRKYSKRPTKKQIDAMIKDLDRITSKKDYMAWEEFVKKNPDFKRNNKS
ncbi:MAG: hypothetical protein V1824_00530 [archaeon]